ncbi:MAG: hypothetical protein IPP29_00270 [Bacteroidetes bacterium]|nr:hypothetical protein [Bacteroidota bacterium]
MMAQWQSGNKYDVATKLLSHVVDSLQDIPNLQTALRMYGHTKKFPPQDCDDTRLEVPFGYRNGYKIKGKLKDLNPAAPHPLPYRSKHVATIFPKLPAAILLYLLPMA